MISPVLMTILLASFLVVIITLVLVLFEDVSGD
jgi:hypothetical protein